MKEIVEPKVFVQLASKYPTFGADGGEWVTIEKYHDKDCFYEDCCAALGVESGAELMCLDIEHVPNCLFGDCDVDVDTVVDMLNSYLDYDVVCDYVDYMGANMVGNCEEVYQGNFYSLEEWAEGFVAEVYGCDLSDFARQYFDYESFARDMRLGGEVFITEKGNVFLSM